MLLEQEASYVPIPRLKTIEGVRAIARLLESEIKMLGIGIESFDGLLFWIDEMFANLNEEEQGCHSSKYSEARKALQGLYNTRDSDLLSFVEQIEDNESIQLYLSEMSTINANKSIVVSFNLSLEYCKRFSYREFYEKDLNRASYSKSIFAKQLERNNLNLANDKLLFWMDEEYAAQGFAATNMYEFGNTILELASYYNRKKLNIGFMNRIPSPDNEIADVLLLEDDYKHQFYEILQLSQSDKWTGIDFRPLQKEYYYDWPPKFKMNKATEDLIRRFDLLILPAPETRPIENYQKLP
ncbi:MAG: hypothetical protein ACJA01_001153 [Saprospiraceae bacterium]